MTRKPALALVLLLALIAGSCAQRGRAAIDQQADSALAQRLHGYARPLVGGEAALVAALPAASTRTQALRLDSGGSSPLDEALPPTAPGCSIRAPPP